MNMNLKNKIFLALLFSPLAILAQTGLEGPAIAAGASAITPAVATLISAGIGLFSSSRSRRDARRRSAEALKRQQEQQARLDEEIEKYRAIKFENPYQNIENPFEDLTVNQQAAQFQAQQVQQQQANLLEGFRGAAGSSGIAGLAQVLANQGALQTQKASASIAQQEQANQRAAASADLRIQQLEGAGDAMVQQAESSRQATILGMNQSVMAGVNANYQQQLLNQQKANAYANQTMINSLSSLATLDLENIGGVNSSNNFNLPETDMVTMPGGSSVNSLPGPDLTPRQYPG